ncbi:MAG: hypothetical protein ACODAC_00095 [Pseudomonadota bacterium]
MKQPLQILLAAALLGAATGVAAAERVMYRFTDDSGEEVYSYTLPSDQAKDGYDKVDMTTGQVLESVAPQPSPEALAEQKRREAALAACRDELERLYALYGSEAEIEFARKEALQSLENRVEQLESNLARARERREDLSARAASAERAGRDVAPALLDRIERNRARIGSLEDSIRKRREERPEIEARFDHELARFRDGTCPDSANTGAS